MQIHLDTPAEAHARSIPLSPIYTAHYNWEIVQYVSILIIVGIISAKDIHIYRGILHPSTPTL